MSKLSLLEITCQSLAPLEHGHIDVPDMRYGARAKYQCDVGHRLEGPAFRTCLADGTWSDETPSCPRKQMPLKTSEMSS